MPVPPGQTTLLLLLLLLLAPGALLLLLLLFTMQLFCVMYVFWAVSAQHRAGHDQAMYFQNTIEIAPAVSYKLRESK